MSTHKVRSALCAFLLLLSLPFSSSLGAEIDSFTDVSGWTPHPADGVSLALSPDAGALRLDFSFAHGGGYAVARKDFSFDLPENYTFRFRIRGNAPSNHLEFKLIDTTGEDVWWHVRRDAVFPDVWEAWSIKKRQISFAWGPSGGGEIRHVAAIEWAITAGSGGTGTVWLDDLELVPLAPPDSNPPAPTASASSATEKHTDPFGSVVPAHPAALAVDGDPSTYWLSAPRDSSASLVLDLGVTREYGGITIDWERGFHAFRYIVEISDDGESWRKVYEVERSTGGLDPIFLPDSESRFIALRALPSLDTEYRLRRDAIAIREVRIEPLEWSASRETLFRNIAQSARRGLYPRGIVGEQSYWTVVGVDGDPRDALLSEDGALEIGPGECSIEPFLSSVRDKTLITWADVAITQSLEEGRLPIPAVHWNAPEVGLTVRASAYGRVGESAVLLSYRLQNKSSEPWRGALTLAIRPFQVNPPSQFLNLRGGVARIHELDTDSRVIRVDGVPRGELLDPVSLNRGDDSAVQTFDEGDLVAEGLAEGRSPIRSAAHDAFGAATGLRRYNLQLAPDGTREISVIVHLYPDSTREPWSLPAGETVESWVERTHAEVAQGWRDRYDRVRIELPPSASHVVESLYAQLGYILINRAGPAIQPGARSYARSWIRDGALTSSALLRLGQHEPVLEFLEWFATHQYENGKIPCCVDQRGADPVPEHDSGGEFIFLIAEYYRYTRDRAVVEKYWPQVERAASYLDSLRQMRRTPEYREAGKEHFFGLLPPSISHEGYSAKPMHSYWDDLFALRGFKDAAFLAGVVGLDVQRAKWDRVRVEFAEDMAASVDAAMRLHSIDYIPGCADLGDFDATSTTIALSPAQAEDVLPAVALERTFEKYWEFFTARRDGAPYDAYTPYEIRNIGAFVHLGWRDRAHELIDFFLADQRPVGWRQWPEVTWPDFRTPRFLGDLPHTWVGSDYVRSILDCFAYVNEHDDSLVLGAGISREWLEEAPGVRVKDLPTPYGALSFSFRMDGEKIVGEIEGEGFVMPAGGIVLQVTHDQQVVRSLPASVVLGE